MTLWIKDIIDTHVPTVDCDATAAEVEEKLAGAGLPGIAVLNPDHSVFGVIGTGDLMHLHRRGDNPAAIHAWEICRTRPPLLRIDASLDEALDAYSEHGSKLLLVIDLHNRFAGLLTAESLLQSHLSASYPAPRPAATTGEMPAQAWLHEEKA